MFKLILIRIIPLILSALIVFLMLSLLIGFIFFMVYYFYVVIPSLLIFLIYAIRKTLWEQNKK